MKMFAFNRSNILAQSSYTLRAALIGVVLAGVSTSAWAADTWLACDGSVVTKQLKGGESTAQTVSDVYVYNDELKKLYKYVPSMQALALLGITAYGDKQIAWSGAEQGTGTWQGTIDRPALSLKQTRDSVEDVMTWTEQCKPTSAQPLK